MAVAFAIPLAALVVATGSAYASSVALNTSLTGAGANWTNFTNTPQGFGFWDASAPYGGDAFDGAGIVTVNGSMYTNPDGDVDVTGQTLTSDAAVVDGLTISLQYTAMTGSQTLRTLVQMTNNTGSSLDRTISYQMNWGSDGSTLIRGTSSGDTALTVGDHWSVTSDSFESDPVNLTAFGTAGGLLPSSLSTAVFSAAGNEGLALNYLLSFEPGETRYLLFFHDLYDTSSQALAEAGAIYDAPLTGERAQGLPSQGIANFSVVPEPSVAALAALGIASVLRRRRK